MKSIMFFFSFLKKYKKDKIYEEKKMNKTGIFYEKFIYSIHSADIRASVELKMVLS